MMTLEEYQRIIYTDDEQYAKYFDAHMALYYTIGRDFASDIKVDVKNGKGSITYIIDKQEVNLDHLQLSLNNITQSLYQSNWLINTSFDSDKNLQIKLSCV